MNRNSSRNARAAVLQMALLVLLVASAPAVAQNNDGTTTTVTTSTSTDEQVKAANQELLNADKFVQKEIPVRKDAWTWYWNEKAHIDTTNSSGFWGDDAVSNVFKSVSNSVVVPFWNAAMEYDFIRAGLLLVVAGMLLGLGASVVLQKGAKKKPE